MKRKTFAALLLLASLLAADASALSLFGKENKDGSYSFTVRDHF